jgi:hypothetical protein
MKRANWEGEVLGDRMKLPWVGFDAWSLGLEASSVIALRALKIAAGGAPADADKRDGIFKRKR